MTDTTGPSDLDLEFHALANRHRRAILEVLAHHPSSISRLADARGLSLPAINKHVAALEAAGMVGRRKIGRTNVLTLNRASMRRVQGWVGTFQAYWGTEKETLENYAAFLDDGSTANEERA